MQDRESVHHGEEMDEERGLFGGATGKGSVWTLSGPDGLFCCTNVSAERGGRQRSGSQGFQGRKPFSRTFVVFFSR